MSLSIPHIPRDIVEWVEKVYPRPRYQPGNCAEEVAFDEGKYHVAHWLRQHYDIQQKKEQDNVRRKSVDTTGPTAPASGPIEGSEEGGSRDDGT